MAYPVEGSCWGAKQNGGDVTLPGVRRNFEAWYGQAWGPVLRAVIGSGVGVDEAEEVVAEAFSKALSGWPRVSRIANPEGWVYRVAVNGAKRRQRRATLELGLRSRTEVQLVQPPGVPAPVWDAVARLPERQRQAIVLRYVVGLHQSEIAEWIGVRPGTVAASLHAARASLRTAMSELEDARHD
ncbi:MAG: hypothetical protein AVDCRST_MAG50-567 [uncultured Acidimicrobiales bacterium]|uniref:RNA polymerase ECF-type sigma factor n=1 Tax=uncultured Acidimicrobiales bacterium TaxID=310071 RepID=A0A6J4HAW9_9ACTN|nr:MAG: hypothetical protein AVDCRST_MAG50-567 [uncultured Acidimicrobiales bacterium]